MFEAKSGCFYSALIITLFIETAYSMECYVCNRQEGNKDKCIKTSMQCLKPQNTCMTKIFWEIPNYWSPYGIRKHFVEKECTTKKICEAKKKEFGRWCQREWYMDWRCAECCQGELCNYYVTLGANSLEMHPAYFLFIVTFVNIFQYIT